MNRLWCWTLALFNTIKLITNFYILSFWHRLQDKSYGCISTSLDWNKLFHGHAAMRYGRESGSLVRNQPCADSHQLNIMRVTPGVLKLCDIATPKMTHKLTSPPIYASHRKGSVAYIVAGPYQVVWRLQATKQLCNFSTLTVSYKMFLYSNDKYREMFRRCSNIYKNHVLCELQYKETPNICDPSIFLTKKKTEEFFYLM
jgi:hypothetical protein